MTDPENPKQKITIKIDLILVQHLWSSSTVRFRRDKTVAQPWLHVWGSSSMMWRTEWVSWRGPPSCGNSHTATEWLRLIWRHRTHQVWSWSLARCHWVLVLPALASVERSPTSIERYRVLPTGLRSPSDSDQIGHYHTLYRVLGLHLVHWGLIVGSLSLLAVTGHVWFYCSLSICWPPRSCRRGLVGVGTQVLTYFYLLNILFKDVTTGRLFWETNLSPSRS